MDDQRPHMRRARRMLSIWLLIRVVWSLDHEDIVFAKFNDKRGVLNEHVNSTREVTVVSPWPDGFSLLCAGVPSVAYLCHAPNKSRRRIAKRWEERERKIGFRYRRCRCRRRPCCPFLLPKTSKFLKQEVWWDDRRKVEVKGRRGRDLGEDLSMLKCLLQIGSRYYCGLSPLDFGWIRPCY
jgi:hypothetical protein